MKYLIRIILSPIIFTLCVAAVAALTAFPLLLLNFYSAVGIISFPFILMLKCSGTKIDFLLPLEDILEPKNRVEILIGHVLGLIWQIWLPFIVTYEFIKKGVLFVQIEID